MNHFIVNERKKSRHVSIDLRIILKEILEGVCGPNVTGKEQSVMIVLSEKSTESYGSISTNKLQ
jgi:hypothetical protein